MTLTFEELVERLKGFDELTLLEMFELSSEEIVELMRDEIEINYDYYYEQITEEKPGSERIE